MKTRYLMLLLFLPFLTLAKEPSNYARIGVAVHFKLLGSFTIIREGTLELPQRKSHEAILRIEPHEDVEEIEFLKLVANDMSRSRYERQKVYSLIALLNQKTSTFLQSPYRWESGTLNNLSFAIELLGRHPMRNDPFIVEVNLLSNKLEIVTPFSSQSIHQCVFALY